MIQTAESKLFAEMLKCGAANLYAHRYEINDLNVFPIPDGDTGDNMSMTASSGVEAIASLNGASVAEVASAYAHGALLGARGNSGVILSRIFAGIAAGLEGCKAAGIPEFKKAMDNAVHEAYSSVANPVEGTILTVVKNAVAVANASDAADLGAYFTIMNKEALCALDRTTDQLESLRRAGVVDSGGAGLCRILEGFSAALNGETSDAFSDQSMKPVGAQTVDISRFTETDKLKFGYCTEFLLRLQESKVNLATFNLAAMISHLEEVGESVVAFRDGSIVKVHVHTFHPGEILEYAQYFGEFLTVKIENMMLGHSGDKGESIPAKKKKQFGIVAVAAGAGIKNSFLSLGIDEVVDGGQSMNPSVSSFIDAFDRTNAKEIFVFPNNGNVILTAKQAAEMYAEKGIIHVIPTHTVGEGYVAASMLDPSSDTPENIIENLTAVAKSVTTGMVSKANRDAFSDGIEIHSGDYIGFAGDSILADAKTAPETLLALADKIPTVEAGVALLICGIDAEDGEAQELYGKLQKRYPDTEWIMLDGGQPIYDYLLILE